MTHPLFAAHSSSQRDHLKKQTSSPSSPADFSAPATPRHDDITKPRATIEKTPRRTRGFVHIEQRLPASPPAADPATATRSVMDILRHRTINAISAMFLPVCRILNTECNNIFGGTPPPSETPSPCARRAPESQESHAASAPAAARTTDQVVPTTPPCTCCDALWRPGGITPDHMLSTASELAAVIASFLSRNVSKETGFVNYAKVLDCPDFVNYMKIARKLRYFDPTLLSPSQRKAFFLNIYNALLIHAIAVVKRPKNKFDRIQLYNSAAYSIGGRAYTLNDIEHGVLRCNRRNTGKLTKNQQFEPEDARLQCVLPEPMDPRIHFALNCGAKSCPPVRYYDPEDVSPALDNATKAFLLGVEIDANKNNVMLSKIFQWYRTDFIPQNLWNKQKEGDLQLLKWILRYLTDDGKIKALRSMITGNSFPTISYETYDWTVNDSSL